MSHARGDPATRGLADAQAEREATSALCWRLAQSVEFGNPWGRWQPEAWLLESAASAPEPIAVLRLDGDWYESTLQCLETLYPCVVEGGLIVVDDYYHWEGCARALHDYFSGTKARERICGAGQVCFLVKLGC